MLLVIVGHTVENSAVRAIIYSFHMPLFFALSGFCQTYCSKKMFKRKILNNAKKLVLPAIIIYAIRLLTGFYGFQRTSTNIGYSIWESLKTLFLFSGVDESILGEKIIGIGIIWYLMTLFLSLTIFYAVQIYFFERQTIVILVLATIGVAIGKVTYLPFSLDIALAVLPFILFGNEIAKHKEFLSRSGFGCIAALLWGGGLILCIFLKGSYLELAARRYPIYPLCFIAACCAICTLFSCSIRLEERFKCTCCIRALKFYGKNSLTLYVVHAMDYLWHGLYTIYENPCLEVVIRVVLDTFICYVCVKLYDLIVTIRGE